MGMKIKMVMGRCMSMVMRTMMMMMKMKRMVVMMMMLGDDV